MSTTHGLVWIAPIRVDRLRSWCFGTGNDPACGSARSTYAAELARTVSDKLIAWRRATHRAGAAAGASTSSAAETRASQPRR
jgi:hypothetical protein